MSGSPLAVLTPAKNRIVHALREDGVGCSGRPLNQSKRLPSASTPSAEAVGTCGGGRGPGAACFREITRYFATDLLTISPHTGVCEKQWWRVERPSPGVIGSSFQDAVIWRERCPGPGPQKGEHSTWPREGRPAPPARATRAFSPPSEWGGGGEGVRKDRSQQKGSPQVSPYPLLAASKKLVSGGGRGRGQQARSETPRELGALFLAGG